MIYLEKMFKKVTDKFAIYDANNLDVKMLSACHSNFWWIP